MQVVYKGATNDQVRWGANDDPRESLVEGKTYNVIRQEVHSWHTKYILAEAENKKFNSACFKAL